MILQHLTIVHLGAIEHFACDFADGLNWLNTRHTEEIAYAIQILLNHKDAVPLPNDSVRADTQIEATVSIEKKKYSLIALPDKAKKAFLLQAVDEQQRDVTAEYLYLTNHCVEQDHAEVFIGTEREMPLRFLQYVNEECYFSRNELHKRTGEMSSLKAFRAYLRQFIKNLQPEEIREGKQYEIMLKSDGRYDVRHKNDDGMPVCLSESEQILFRYLCFLRTAEFWHGFEELRNLHSIHKPIIIMDFLERLDESIDIQDIITRTMLLGRQCIILTTVDKGFE